MAKKHNFKVGDKVAYSVQFLKNIGSSHSELARMRGEIIEFKEFGITLAKIKWTVGKGLEGDGSGLVNVGNLAKVGTNSKFCNVG